MRDRHHEGHEEHEIEDRTQNSGVRTQKEIRRNCGGKGPKILTADFGLLSSATNVTS
jgi:hypothetical protein